VWTEDQHIGPAKFCVVDKRFGECPSERENERFENGDPQTVFDTRTGLGWSRAKALTLRRALQAA
jgi:hypothetical protein